MYSCWSPKITKELNQTWEYCESRCALSDYVDY